MKISVLCENTSLNNFECEHGLSLYIETKKNKILFDMGQTDLFSRNAERLGIDLSEVDIAILSHGHYDHGGGLNVFLKINSKAPIYLSRYAFGEHYNGAEKYIGLDKSLTQNKRLIFTDDTYKIDDRLTLYHKNQSEPTPFPINPAGLSVKENGRFQSEKFLHEQYLMIEENGKSILISGCSHKGILNINEWFSPDVFVGGFHFMKLDNSQYEILNSTASKLMINNTDYYTCHCTGEQQFEFMKKHMGSRLSYIRSGMTFEI